MGEAILARRGGGAKINGIIEQYRIAAKENISAGDFVQFINEVKFAAEKQLSSTSYTGSSTSAVLLSNGRVFIAYSYGSSPYLYCIIVSIDDTNIVLGPELLLSSAGYDGSRIDTKLLPDGRVFIAHSRGSNYQLYGLVVKIDNMTPMINISDTLLSSAAQSGNAISIVLLKGGAIFIAHSYGTASYLYGMVVSITDTNIVGGADTLISNVDQSGRYIGAILLHTGKICIAHSITTSYVLVCTIVAIEGLVVSPGKYTTISPTNLSGQNYIQPILVPTGEVVIIHSYSGSLYLYGIVITIDNTDTVKEIGADTQLSLTTGTTQRPSIELLSDGRIFIARKDGGTLSAYLHGIIIATIGLTIKLGKYTQISSLAISTSGINLSTLLLSTNRLLVVYGNVETTARMVGMVSQDLGVRASDGYKFSDDLLGIAKSDSNNGLVNVYTPGI